MSDFHILYADEKQRADKLEKEIELLKQKRKELLSEIHTQIIDYIYNQGVKINGRNYWCILEAPHFICGEINESYENELERVIANALESFEEG